jgi:hypothetical protein
MTFFNQIPIYVSVITNPIIYGAMNKQYMEAYKVIVRTIFCCNSIQIQKIDESHEECPKGSVSATNAPTV